MPTLLTQTSILPKWSSAVRPSRSTSSASLTSTVTAMATPPVPVISATRSSRTSVRPRGHDNVRAQSGEFDGGASTEAAGRRL